MLPAAVHAPGFAHLIVAVRARHECSHRLISRPRLHLVVGALALLAFATLHEVPGDMGACSIQLAENCCSS